MLYSRRVLCVLATVLALGTPAALMAQSGVASGSRHYYNAAGDFCIETFIMFWTTSGDSWVDTAVPFVEDEEHDPESQEAGSEENPDPHGLYDSAAGDDTWEPITPGNPQPQVTDDGGTHKVKWSWTVCFPAPYEPAEGDTFTVSWDYRDAAGNWQSASHTHPLTP